MTTSLDQAPKKRKAEFITPPNHLREKVGAGGLDEKVLEKAETVLKATAIDFKPMAEMHLNALNETIRAAQHDRLDPEAAIEGIIYPAMQLKANGGMFQYQLVTDVANLLVQFLEAIDKLNPDAFEVIKAHNLTLKTVVGANMKGDGGPQGQALASELGRACQRYFEKYK